MTSLHVLESAYRISVFSATQTVKAKKSKYILHPVRTITFLLPNFLRRLENGRITHTRPIKKWLNEKYSWPLGKLQIHLYRTYWKMAEAANFQCSQKMVNHPYKTYQKMSKRAKFQTGWEIARSPRLLLSKMAKGARFQRGWKTPN